MRVSAQVQHLYIGNFFRSCLKAARAQASTNDWIFVLSALHGLLTLSQIIEPYDLKMGDPGSILATELTEQLRCIDIDDSDVFWTFLPAAYLKTFTTALSPLREPRIHDVFAGLAPGIGPRLAVNARLNNRGLTSSLI